MIPKIKPSKLKKLILPIGVLTLLVFLFLQKQFFSAVPSAEPIHPSLLDDTNLQETVETINIEEDNSIFIEVKGAVQNPGVYELENGDRVLTAIELAGGYLPEGDSKTINHAQKVEDEMIIYVPLVGEEVVTPANSATSSSKDQLININKADIQGLTSLPGIGPAKAEAIISYREENGGFKSVQDLMEVTGIGQKTFEKLETYITVK